jgi:hypothetical protein
MKRALFVVACILHAYPAVAADKADTSDGRIDGDLAVAVGAGATFGPRDPRAAADLRFRYLWTVGAFATYEDGALVGAASEPKRVLATGLELRPLFIARWLNGLEWGKPYADLTLDSLGLELGAVFLQPQGGSFGGRPGLQAGLGIEIPILPHATGPLLGLHGGVRWSDAALAAHPLQGPADRALYLGVTLAWQQVFGSHLVDLGDRAP